MKSANDSLTACWGCRYLVTPQQLGSLRQCSVGSTTALFEPDQFFCRTGTDISHLILLLLCAQPQPHLYYHRYSCYQAIDLDPKFDQPRHLIIRVRRSSRPRSANAQVQPSYKPSPASEPDTADDASFPASHNGGLCVALWALRQCSCMLWAAL
jgi:hypothetical protein